MSTNLNALPEELLLSILTHISDLNTQLALSKTSSRLHRLTVPHLYYSFPGRNSELFLRTISHSPSLATHIKSAVWNQERKTMPRIDVLEKQHILTRINELAVPRGTDLAAQYAKYGKSDDYWWFEILTLFMPALDDLCVRESWLWDDHHYWFKSLSPFFNPLSCSNLRTARLDGPMRIENIVPLLTIETLRSLDISEVIVMRREGYRVFQWSTFPVERVLPERSSRLERLCIRQSYVAPEMLEPVLKGIKALKEFTYEHHPNSLTDESVTIEHPFTGPHERCLSYHAQSLEMIRIRERGPNWPWSVYSVLDHNVPDDHDHPPPEPRIRKYPRLRTVDIGIELQPEALETFTTEPNMRVFTTGLAGVERLRLKFYRHHSKDKDVEHFLNALARAIVLYNPGLRTVEVIEWDPFLGWYPQELPMLQTMYHALGLRLVSVPAGVRDFCLPGVLVVEEDKEPGWVYITDMHEGWCSD